MDDVLCAYIIVLKNDINYYKSFTIRNNLHTIQKNNKFYIHGFSKAGCKTIIFQWKVGIAMITTLLAVTLLCLGLLALFSKKCSPSLSNILQFGFRIPKDMRPHQNKNRLIQGFLALFLLFSYNAQADEITWGSENYQHHYADFNGDGLPDLLLQSHSDENYHQLILGELSEDGYKVLHLKANQQLLPEFLSHHNWNTSLAKLVLGDFNGDNNDDLLVILPSENTALIYLYSELVGLDLSSAASFQYNAQTLSFLTEANQIDFFSGDFNGDKRADLIALSSDKQPHYLLHASQSGELAIVQEIHKSANWGKNRTETVYIADYNNDGRDDVVTLPKKKNKSPYIVYADSQGFLDKNGTKIKEKFNGKDINTDDYSLIIYPAEDANSLDIIRFNNIGGGIDENGNVILADPKGDFDNLEDKCDQVFFSTADNSDGLTCRPFNNQSTVSNKLASISGSQLAKVSTPNLVGDCGPLNILGSKVTSANGNTNDLCVTDPPETPPSYPSVSGGSYHPLGSTVTVTVSSIPNANFYEIYLSTYDGGYSKVSTTQSTSASVTIRNSWGYNYIKYKACNSANNLATRCSGLSPWKRIQAYHSPSRAYPSVSPTSISRGATATVTWPNPGYIIYSGTTYQREYTLPNGSTVAMGNISHVGGSTQTSFTTPAFDVSGAYTFSVRACNPSLPCGPWGSTVLTVDNQAPTITGNPLTSIFEGSEYKFTPGASDPENDTLRFTPSNKPAWASFNFDTGELKGTPSFANAGTYSNISICVTDEVDQDCLTFSITVVDNNRAPYARTDSVAEVTEDTAYNINVVGNDTDPDNNNLSLVNGSFSGASYGTVTKVNGTTVKYLPNLNVCNKSDSFTYQITDDHGSNHKTDSGTVNILAIKCVNDAATGEVKIGGVAIEHGTLTATNTLQDVEGLGTITYKWFQEGSGSQIGTGSSYTLGDADVGKNIKVTAFYIDGGGSAESVSSSYVGPVVNVPEGTLSPPTISPSGGTYQVSKSISISAETGTTIHYKKNSGNYTEYTGAFSITSTTIVKAYATKSDWNNSSVAQGTIIINHPPVAVDDSLTAIENDSSGTTKDVIANDTDVDNDTLTISSVNNNASHGTATKVNGTTVKYVPTAGYCGTDFFTYVVSDDRGGTDTGRVDVSFTCQGTLPPPIIAPNSGTYQESTLIDITATAGATIYYRENTGTYAEYLPPLSISTTTTVEAYATMSGWRDSLKVSGTITINHAPIAEGDSLTTTADNSSGTILDVIVNDTDVDSDTLEISSVGGAGNGTVTQVDNSSVKYIPTTDYCGSDSFTYVVSDTRGGTDTGTVSVSVECNNQAPIANDDEAYTAPLTLVNIPVLVNDTDGDDDTLTIASATTVNGTVTISADNTLDYTPNENAGATEVITYIINDGTEDSAPASVVVTIGAAPAEIIIDNLDANTVANGTWSVSSGTVAYQSNSVYNNTGGTFEWHFELPIAANYNVYAWWTYASIRDANVPYRVHYGQGLDEVFVNQRDSSKSGQWILLGNYNFPSGSNSFVEIEGRKGTSSADAIKLEFTGTFSPLEVTTSALPFALVDTQYSFSLEALGSPTGIEWSIISGELPAGITMSPSGVISGTATAVTMEQAPVTFEVVNAAQESVQITLSLEVFDQVTPLAEIIVDNSDTTNTVITGTWPASVGKKPYKLNSVYNNEGGNFEWHFDIPVASNYNVYVWWTNASIRTDAAPYTIHNGVENLEILINQKSSSEFGKWVLIGNYDFPAGSDNYIDLKGTVGTSSADAVRLERVGPVSAETNIVFQDADGNLYIELIAEPANKYLKLSLVGGIWVVTEITQAQMDALTLTKSDFTLEFGEFAGDALEDFRLANSDGSTEIIIEQSSEGYRVSAAQDWLATGGSVIDAAIATPTSSASTFNGAMAGSASVNGGSASYSIPIAIAPGRAGMQPNVSLNYSSRSGLGVAGVGWGLSAGGAISRCGATEAQDGFTKGVSYNQSTDKLCLNGERLLIKAGVYGENGATYITEIDSFLTVTQIRGDISDSGSYFEVALASGAKQIYGKSTDSTVVADGVTAPLSWLINREQDVANVNHMTYNYADYGVGEVLLSDITYTGSATSEGTRKVTFDYNAIPQYRTSYLAGGKSRQSQKLTTITAYKEGSAQVRQYNLVYSPSTATERLLLQSVQECGNGTPCRETTSFDWLDATTTYQLEQLTTNTNDDLVESVIIDGIAYVPEMTKVLPRGDIDGNGSRDWAKYFTDAEGNIDTRASIDGKNNFNYEPCTRNYITKQIACIDADFDLDGITDSWEIDTNETLKITYSNDLTIANTVIDLTHSSAVSNNELVNIGDYNGDGWPDVVVYEAVQSIPTSTWSGDVYIYFHSKSKTNPYSLPKEFMLSVLPNESIQYVGDIDGDGLPDLASSKLIDPTWDSRPTMTSVHLTRIDNQRTVSFDTMPLSLPDSVDNHENFSMLIDVNGDGLSDWVGWVAGQGAYLHLRLNKGDGTFESPQWLDFQLPVQSVFLPVDGGSEITIAPKFADALKSMDIDGDGRAELIMPGNLPSDMLVEGCMEFSEYNQLSDSWSVIKRCGSSIYSSYKIKVNNAGIRANAPSSWDYSIYKYNALRFVENTNGTFSVEYDVNTGLVAGANHSAVVDSFGKGLADLVFTYGCPHVSCSIESVSGDMVGKTVNTVHFNRNYGSPTIPAPGPEDYEPTDMMVKVTNNATGLISQWQYLPLSSTKAGDSFYHAERDFIDDAHFNFASSMYVVAKFEQSNGVGVSSNEFNAYNYEYRDAMYNSEGRGFRGFKTIIEQDVRNGISTQTNFKQKFPYSSLVENQARYLGNSLTPFSYTKNEWLENTNYFGLGFNVYNASSTAYSCQLDMSCGTSFESNYLIKSETTTLQSDVDQYGNIALQTTTINDAYGTYQTDKGAVFDASESWPHKITSSFVTSNPVLNRNSDVTIAANTDDLKTVTTTYADYNGYRKPETVTTVGDGVSITTATTYTSFAQLDVTTISGLVGTVIQSRETDIDYSTDGYFPNAVNTKASNTVTHITTMVTDSGTGQPLSQTNAANVTTSYIYDSFGRLEQLSQSGTPAQTVRYYTPDSDAGNSNAVMMMVTRQAGVPESGVYQDALGRTLRTRTQGFDGSNVYQDTIYNLRGLVDKQSNLHSGMASYTTFDNYDALGRLTNKTSPQTNGILETVYTYNVGGSLQTQIDVYPTDGTSITLYKTYNALKQLVSTTDANGGNTDYAYDGRGNPIVIKDANDNQITASYDALGRKLWVNDPNMGRTNFVYNAFGELESETDANGDTITYDEVDLLGRVLKRTADSNTATFEWDTLKPGLLTQHKNDDVTKSFTYDGNARVETTTIAVDSDVYITTNSYDGNYGRLKSMQYPNGLTVGYRYNDNGYLSEEFNAQSDYNYRTITELSSFGDITQATLGNSAADINITNSYSSISGQMLSSSAMGNDLGARSTIHSLHYDRYDSYGNLKEASNGAITSASIGNNTLVSNEIFTYDNLHRLKTAQVTAGGTNAPTIDYGYDAVGNFTHKSDYSTNNPSAYSYVAGTNKLNQITLKDNISIATFGYDAKGNQTHRNGQPQPEVTYNSFNKPLTINKNSANLGFNYGADLMRYKQQRTVNGEVITTHYVDKHYEVEKKGTNTTTKAYISDIAIISDGDQVGDKSIRFTLKDRLGSTTTFADHNGNGTSYRYFDPFGKPRSGDRSLLSSLSLAPQLANNPLDMDMATRRGFTDHEHLDEVELIHMNGRVYDYNVGRFMSVDPFIQEPGNSQSINPYSYIMNNPLAGTDPTGYSAESSLCQGAPNLLGCNGKGGMSKDQINMSHNPGTGRDMAMAEIGGNQSNWKFNGALKLSSGSVQVTDIESVQANAIESSGDGYAINQFADNCPACRYIEGGSTDDYFGSFIDAWSFTDISAPVMVDSAKKVAEESLEVLDMATMIPGPGTGAAIIKGTAKGTILAGAMLRKSTVIKNITQASVDDKLARYLLNMEHSVGGSKAKWFEKALGFNQKNLGDLAKQIIFNEKSAVKTALTEHGQKFNQVIPITGANGRKIDVTFSWIRNNDGAVRLVTGIPAKK